MESPSNPNFRGSNGDPRDYPFPSISQQNLQIELMRAEPGSTEQFVQDVILSNPASEENHSVNNPTAAEAESMRGQQPEPGQRQPADISSADSHPRINCIPENTAPDPRRARKREADPTHRGKKKEEQKRRKFDLVTLKAECEFLKEENKKYQIQSKEYKKLKKKYEKQHEIEQQMKSNLKKLEAEKEFLRKENVAVNS